MVTQTDDQRRAKYVALLIERFGEAPRPAAAEDVPTCIDGDGFRGTPGQRGGVYSD